MTSRDYEIFVSYGYIFLVGEAELGDLISARQGQANGICGARVPGQLSMMTGTHTGTVRFRLELLDTAPPVADHWEDVVEVSLDIPHDSMQLAAFDDWHDPVAFSPGSYRARYCAVGMDQGDDAEGAEEPSPDQYLLALWPAPPAPELVLRQTSSTAQYWASVATGTEKQFRDSQPEVEWSTEGIDVDAWGGSVPGQRLLESGHAAGNLATIDRPLADAVADLTDQGHHAIIEWVCTRLAPQARAAAGVDWHAAVEALVAGSDPPPPFDDFTKVEGILYGLDEDGYPRDPGPPAPKDVVAARAVLRAICLPAERPVEQAVELLVDGYQADQDPESFLDHARKLVGTLPSVPSES